jgi:hypothetical protein
MKNFIVGALIIGLAIVVGFMVVNPAVNYRGSSGPTYTELQYFGGGMIVGGPVRTITTATSTFTWTVGDICNYSTWIISGNAADASTTLPTATSTIPTCFLNNGDSKTIIFYNKTVNDASSTQFVVGNGMIKMQPDASAANTVIGGGNIARITFFRASSTALFVAIEDLANQ